jgi:molecular chaperone GrpE
LTKKHEHKVEAAPQPDEKDKQIEDLKNKYLRSLADMENLRKRAAAEKEDIAKFSNESIIRELLPVLDGFGKAIDLSKSADTGELVKGVELVKKLIDGAFAKFGVAKVDAVGKKYDPNFHEAMFMKESDGEAGVVLEEVLSGYTLHGRLIRPAMVIVSKAKEMSNE